MTDVLAPKVTRPELLHRADELVAVLASRAQEAECLRRIPDATVTDLRESGLIRIANPDAPELVASVRDMAPVP
jgi:hypothetical protein